MIILGIETSCDETAAAVLEQKRGRIQILSNIVASSASLQSKYGGIIPEQAAREQVKSIIPVIKEAINSSHLTINQLDAIAITYGPGLIGSLLVGVETAKVLSLIWNKPLVPINHLLGHFYANWILEAEERSLPQFPFLGLLVSGGHTELILFKNHNDYKYLGGTRDDAAGECFDKCARLLGFPYPGGPQISKLAETGNPKAFNLPFAMADSKDHDFSFSGLKTAFSNMVKKTKLEGQTINDLCASLELAIVKSLVKKTITAAKKYSVNQIMVAGGVAANKKLKEHLQFSINNSQLTINLLIPPPDLCTDNGAMIVARAFFEKPIKKIENLQANPNLSLEN